MLSLQSCLTLSDPMVTARLLCQWDTLGKNTGVGCHALLQEIFPTQGLIPSLMSPALASGLLTTSATWEDSISVLYFSKKKILGTLIYLIYI